MNKNIFAAALLCCSMASGLQAETGALYLTSPNGYQVLAMSPNGLWACGIQYNEESGSSIAFRWNLSTGRIETLGAETSATGIANDGTVAGSFQTSNSEGNDIEAPGIWNNGQWTMLENPCNSGAWAYAITPDGQYVTGTDNNYISYIWKNGEIAYTAEAGGVGNTFLTYSISPDGSRIGGWAYYHSNNRNAGYWDTSDQKFHALIPGDPGAPWQRVIKFSPDSRKLLYWGGYTSDPDHADKGNGIRALYDIETQTTSLIYPTHEDPWNIDFYDMGGNLSVVGVQQEEDGTEYGIICQGGQAQYIEPYLRNLGADFSNLGVYQINEDFHYIARAMCISEDEKKYALLCYTEEFEFFTLIVMLDQNITHLPPVCLEATQSTGILSANITWEKPLGDISALQGYNLYRDGEKINSELISGLSYYDTQLEAKSYTYCVTAVYEGGESEMSESADVTLVAKQIEAPTAILARQKGYNSAFVTWEHPATNFCQLTYYNAGDELGGFGGGTVSFETGVLFPAEQLALYQGYKLTGVCFRPNSEQGSWIVNLYSHDANGDLKLLRAYNVSQALTYGEVNTFYLPQQIALQAGQDLLVGIQTNVTNESYDIQMVSGGCKKSGYSDLLRQVGEESFYSYKEMGGEDIAWNTSILMAPAGTTKELDHVDHYNLYLNGEKSGETEGYSFTRSDLSDGSYTVGIEAVYTDERVSAMATRSISIEASDKQLKSILPHISLEGEQMTATWEAPLDDDCTLLSWCGDTKGSRHPTLSEGMSELLVRVDFPASKFKSYDNYQISTLSFYPLANASYELLVYEDATLIIDEEYLPVQPDAWNNLHLTNPVPVSEGHDYRFIIYCYDCPEGEAPMAFDGNSTRSAYSNLYMAQGDEGWSNADSYSTLYMQGNWMMRMEISECDAQPLPVSGYNVYVDDDLVADELLETSYSQSFASGGRHTLRVDAIYAGGKTLTGYSAAFNVGGTAIEEVSTEELSECYNLYGQRVTTTHGTIIQNRHKHLFIR